MLIVQGELLEGVRARDPRRVQRALDAGADPDAAEPRGRSALVIAAESGAEAIVRQLLEAGASPDVVSGFEYTPLRAAAVHDHAGITRLLLERGADPNFGDKRASITHEILGATADGRSRVAIVVALLDAGGAARSAEERLIIAAISRGAVPAILRVLLAHGEDPNARRTDGTPAIVLASRRDDQAAIDTLLQARANPDSTDQSGRTALMHAVERGHDSVVRILLSYGADAGRVAPDGTTAILLARSLHRGRMQLLLGDRDLRRRAVKAIRTTIELKPRVYELRGSPELFDTWAQVIDHALAELGIDEFETLVGKPEEAARFSERLRQKGERAPGPSVWYVVVADPSEVAIIHGCLLNVAGGPPMAMPDGLTRSDVADLFEDLQSQLR